MSKLKYLPRIASASALLMAVIVLSSASNSDASREALVAQSSEKFDPQTVEEIRASSSDLSYDSAAEEIKSMTTVAVGWMVCQEALPAYLSVANAATAPSQHLRQLALDLLPGFDLTPEVQSFFNTWVDLVFGPLADGLSAKEISDYAYWDRCGIVQATLNGIRTTISNHVAGINT